MSGRRQDCPETGQKLVDDANKFVRGRQIEMMRDMRVFFKQEDVLNIIFKNKKKDLREKLEKLEETVGKPRSATENVLDRFYAIYGLEKEIEEFKKECYDAIEIEKNPPKPKRPKQPKQPKQPKRRKRRKPKRRK